MSVVTQSGGVHRRSRPRTRYEKANRLFSRAVEDRELCNWCFARKRRFYPDDDAREAYELRWGRTKQTLTAKGHSIGEDGTLQVNTATSDPDPATYTEVVPHTRIGGRFHPPRPRVICSCGVIDLPRDENRSLCQLHTCVDNLIEWFDTKEFTTFPEEIDGGAAHDRTTQLRQYDTLVARDEVVLTEALRGGLWG